ncbi:MAG: ribonuclease J [Lachnospiraceae bacterium]|nr:ribonuclease J [Lachnospiraceae bacterium]
MEDEERQEEIVKREAVSKEKDDVKKEEKPRRRVSRRVTAQKNENSEESGDKKEKRSLVKGVSRRGTKKVSSYSQSKKQEVEFGKGLKIIQLGGLEQIGMNITAFEYEDSIIVVDCGLSFPEDSMLGIDLVIPDVTYLKNNIEKVKAFVITHGHEDHIGALPYVLKEINVPVYATKLTMGLIENKLKEHVMPNPVKEKVVNYGQTVHLGCFKVEFIRTNHSISDAAALAIYSPVGTIVHTGDFKVDYTPVNGEMIDLPRFAEIGKKGVLALMCDSTNVMKPGFTMSERSVGKTFDNIFADNEKNRIIVATFASNVDRVQQIINSAEKHGRKVVIEGRSMVNVITTATELGYLNVPDNILIDMEQMKNYPSEKLVLITTGSQGEAMAALSRMAADLHRKVKIEPGDTVIFSSKPIPGNEKSVTNVINELTRKGAKVIVQNTHVSGHACQEEIKLIYALTRPQYAIPVHGEYQHLKAHAELARQMGVPKENTIILSSGDVLEISPNRAGLVGKVQAQGIMVDGLGVGDVGNIVLRDRQNLSENGLIIIVLTLEKYTNQLLAGPDIVSRGFVYVRESEYLMDEAKSIVYAALERCLDQNVSDWSKIKTEIKDSLSDYLWKKMKRNPMILPIIMEIE